MSLVDRWFERRRRQALEGWGQRARVPPSLEEVLRREKGVPKAPEPSKSRHDAKYGVQESRSGCKDGSQRPATIK